jgi:hypothetical protein
MMSSITTDDDVTREMMMSHNALENKYQCENVSH